MSYWDSSALVKLYVQEPDSAEFRALALTMRCISPRRKSLESWNLLRRM